MSLDVKTIAGKMLGAAKSSLGADWKKVSVYAKTEFKRLAQSLADITEDVAKGRLTVAEGASLLRIHRNTSITVVNAVKGMSLIAAEKAVNAALEVVKEAVNKASGGILL